MTPWATASGRLPRLQWAAAFRPLAGQSVSGDQHVVAPFEGGVLLAAVDALGHGEEAEYAARLAAATLLARRDTPVPELLKECHRSLGKTRGVAAAIASIDFRRNRLHWIAVGNVEGVLVRGPESKMRRHSIIQHGGIVGYQLPKIPPIDSVALEDGDRLCFATDGVRSGFSEVITLTDSLPALAARVLEKFEDVRDDALVLIAEHGGR